MINIRTTNLSFDEPRLIAQIRNISDYENKSKEDLIKALSEPKPKPEPKPQTPKPEPNPQTPKPQTKPKSEPQPDTKPKLETKPQTPKPQTKPKSEPQPEPETPKTRVKTNKRKLRKLRKDFDELRHKFSKREIDRYRKTFYISKNKKYLSESEIEEIRKNFNELKEV